MGKRQSNEEIYSIIASIPVSAKGVFAVETETVKTTESGGGITKKNRRTKEPTPARLQKITTRFTGTATFGLDYAEMVNSQLEREGKTADFESQGTYCKPVSENLLIWEYAGNNKEKIGQLYFRMYIDYMSTGGTCQFFDANGKEISLKEYSQIKEDYLAKDYESQSQGTDKEIMPRNVKAENVVYLKRVEVWLERKKDAMGKLIREAV